MRTNHCHTSLECDGRCIHRNDRTSTNSTYDCEEDIIGHNASPRVLLRMMLSRQKPWISVVKVVIEYIF